MSLLRSRWARNKQGCGVSGHAHVPASQRPWDCGLGPGGQGAAASPASWRPEASLRPTGSDSREEGWARGLPRDRLGEEDP